MGPSGPQGPAGAAGADGPSGPQGPAGNGLAQYAYIYNFAPLPVLPGSAFIFDETTLITPGITHESFTSDITLGVAGTYKVSFVVAASEGQEQIGLAINGVVQTQTIYGSAGQTFGQAMLTFNVGDVLTLVNTGTTATSPIQLPNSMNASLTIEQISPNVPGPGI
jgi:hypothetical protein